MERVKTGISGLDKLLGGGLPKGSFTIVSGGPGTGKTIFGIQFLMTGADKFGEKGLYISIEQPGDEIIEQAKQFGWKMDQLVEKGKIRIVSLDVERLFESKWIDEFTGLIESDSYDRAVIDSITSLVFSPLTPSRVADAIEGGVQPTAYLEMSRANASILVDRIRKTGITTLGIAEKIDGMPGDTIDRASEFKADGLIVLNATAVGKTFIRTIQVKKMRKTKIDGVPHSFDFTKNGITLLE